MNINDAKAKCGERSCVECAKEYDMPYRFCCLIECNEHEMCRNCTKGINLLKEDEPKKQFPEYYISPTLDGKIELYVRDNI